MMGIVIRGGWWLRGEDKGTTFSLQCCYKSEDVRVVEFPEGIAGLWKIIRRRCLRPRRGRTHDVRYFCIKV